MNQISLKAARVNAGMTQKEVALRMQRSRNTIIKWEKGIVDPSPSEFFYLCSIYGVSEGDIFLSKEQH